MDDAIFNIELIITLLLLGGVISFIAFVFFMFVMSFLEQ